MHLNKMLPHQIKVYTRANPVFGWSWKRSSGKEYQFMGNTLFEF